MSADSFYSFLPDGVTFRCPRALASRLIYAPLCGTDGLGIKSAITPFLSGDIKIDKGAYLTKPASREDLRAPLRNCFAAVAGKGVFSFLNAPGEQDTVEIGPLWHKVIRRCPSLGLEAEALTFVPVSGETLELTRFTLRNISAAPLVLTPTTAVPVFGRALANKHDHEHVTALLQRVSVLPEGVLVEPTMLFNEEGHRPAKSVYYVFGAEGAGVLPAGSFPTVERFVGDGGSWAHPQAISRSWAPSPAAAAGLDGQEAAGALRFADVTLKPGEQRSYITAVGIARDREAALVQFRAFASDALFDAALAANSSFWKDKTAAVTFRTGDTAFSSWMRWVTLQPVLRRIFGCSFLPDHDYGKGGKGWRDIWQDLLSLILIEPGEVRAHLLNNFGGVRIDGSNATIIGQKPGEFIADRNAITRVWMDHGVWPFITTLLYINQSGDLDFLLEPAPYFADPQLSRSLEKDADWTPAGNNRLHDRNNAEYHGTVLEHILVEHLVPFFNVGDHNITRLESADWNDGLDMAFARGESVTFMAFYAGNLLAIADLLETLATARGLTDIVLAKELLFLLDSVPGGDPVDYASQTAKQGRLFKDYFKAVQPMISGTMVTLAVQDICADLRRKGRWAFDHIRAHEKVAVDGQVWFNGYYDNNAARVEGKKDSGVRMTLTGQVFPLMSGLATREETAQVVKAVDAYLFDRHLGGYRLNTDFGMRTYLAMGRAFGFAFGTKENGAVFSHMAVMYSYALYKQGFAREGHKVLRSLYDMSRHPERARIYPGVPEYFDGQGRGMYHFLTGSASWYVLTLLTMAFGVRSDNGDLLLAPQLVREEFDARGEAGIAMPFAGKKITVTYVNAARKDAGEYAVGSVTLNGRAVRADKKGPGVLVPRALIAAADDNVEIKVTLQ